MRLLLARTGGAVGLLSNKHTNILKMSTNNKRFMKSCENYFKRGQKEWSSFFEKWKSKAEDEIVASNDDEVCHESEDDDIEVSNDDEASHGSDDFPCQQKEIPVYTRKNSKTHAVGKRRRGWTEEIVERTEKIKISFDFRTQGDCNEDTIMPLLAELSRKYSRSNPFFESGIEDETLSEVNYDSIGNTRNMLPGPSAFSGEVTPYHIENSDPLPHKSLIFNSPYLPRSRSFFSPPSSYLSREMNYYNSPRKLPAIMHNSSLSFYDRELPSTPTRRPKVDICAVMSDDSDDSDLAEPKPKRKRLASKGEEAVASAEDDVLVLDYDSSGSDNIFD